MAGSGLTGIGKIGKRLYRKKSPYIRIIANKDCYFVSHKIPAGVKTDKGFIQLNYNSESPFSHHSLVYLKKREVLYIWFIRHEDGSDDKGRFLIPESLLLASALGKPGKSLITVCSSENSTDIVASHGGRILAQYTRGKWYKTDDKNVIDSISREHGLNSPEIITITESSKAAIIENGIDNLHLTDLRGLWHGSAKEGSNVLQVIAKLLPLAVICIVLLTIIEVFAIWNLERKVGALNHKIAGLKQDIGPVLEIRQEHDLLRHYWQNFIDNEVSPVSQLTVYFSIIQTIAEMNGQLVRWNGNKTSIVFSVETADAVALLDQIRLLDGCNSTKIDGSVRKNKKNNLEKVTFSVALNASEKQ